ncbi:MAG: efflux RND transporter periplasmic adaptor subunit [Deltaproteobacteria bacterium]|nr:efflux RND transporter periplasmic adaptor subunit [Deltaproteobacteria bacterium]
MKKKSRFFLHTLVALSLLAVGAAVLVILVLSRPPAAKQTPHKQIPLVRVFPAKHEEVRIIVEGEGTVTPVQESSLATQVSGRVEFISPALVDGGAFKAGDVLVRVDQKDYRLAVTLAQSGVKEAETKLQLAQEETAAAKDEWARLYRGEKGSGGPPPPLVARLPQLEQSLAALEAAKAKLSQAELDLYRTEIRAPYDGQVDEKQVDVGQYIRSGDKVAKIFATAAAEVRVPLENRDLAWIDVPGFTSRNDDGSQAEVTADLAGHEEFWPGRVLRAESTVDVTTRLVPVVVRVEKPYATRPPLAMGLFVKVRIQGHVLKGANLLPRDALRPDNIVWVADAQGILHFTPVKVARLAGDKVVIQPGLPDGSQVVLTPLKAVTDGMQVKVAPQDAPGSAPLEPDATAAPPAVAPAKPAAPGGPAGPDKGDSRS